MSRVDTKAARGGARGRWSSWKMGVAVLLLLAVVVAVVACVGPGRIPYRGRIVLVPLPPGSIRLSVTEARARYIVPGSRDIKPWVSDYGPRLGWRFRERLGGINSIVSTRGEEFRLVMVTEPKTRFFTQIDCYVEPDPEAAPAAP